MQIAEVFLLSKHLALDPRRRAVGVDEAEAEFCGWVEVARFERFSSHETQDATVAMRTCCMRLTGNTKQTPEPQKLKVVVLF